MPQRPVSVILAVPGKVALKIDESLLNTHLVYFSRHGVLDTWTARILLRFFIKKSTASSGEAGGAVPDRNIERMLRDTHVPVPPADMRRLDLIVPSLGVDRGLPLFCDVTCVTPITGRGFARSGPTTINGAILRDGNRFELGHDGSFWCHVRGDRVIPPL